MATISFDDPLLWMVAVLLALATGLACALLAETRCWPRRVPADRSPTAGAEPSTPNRPH